MGNEMIQIRNFREGLMKTKFILKSTGKLQLYQVKMKWRVQVLVQFQLTLLRMKVAKHHLKKCSGKLTKAYQSLHKNQYYLVLKRTVHWYLFHLHIVKFKLKKKCVEKESALTKREVRNLSLSARRRTNERNISQKNLLKMQSNW